jgi:hypothetical protein
MGLMASLLLTFDRSLFNFKYFWRSDSPISMGLLNPIISTSFAPNFLVEFVFVLVFDLYIIRRFSKIHFFELKTGSDDVHNILATQHTTHNTQHTTHNTNTPPPTKS